MNVPGPVDTDQCRDSISVCPAHRLSFSCDFDPVFRQAIQHLFYIGRPGFLRADIQESTVGVIIINRVGEIPGLDALAFSIFYQTYQIVRLSALAAEGKRKETAGSVPRDIPLTLEGDISIALRLQRRIHGIPTADKLMEAKSEGGKPGFRIGLCCVARQ